VWSGYRLGASSQIHRADHEAGFIVVPSGTTPCVTNRHSAISSLRASATIITFRTRVPVTPARLRSLSFGSGRLILMNSLLQKNVVYANDGARAYRYPIRALSLLREDLQPSHERVVRQ
jgi:hypothetical protein